MVVGDLWLGADTRLMIVDLPTFGKPTRPTSAKSLSSRVIQRSSPFSPFSAKAGARWVELTKARVAASAAPPLGDDDLLTMMAQIAE